MKQKSQEPDNFRVLVVDDDPEIGTLFRRVLANRSQTVTVARDGYEAIEVGCNEARK